MRVETLWRCSRCGKWSYAKKRPSYHQRFIKDTLMQDAEEIAKELGLPILRVTPETQIAVDDFDPGGVTVRCGPFETWEARRVVEDTRPLSVHTLGRIHETL